MTRVGYVWMVDEGDEPGITSLFHMHKTEDDAIADAKRARQGSREFVAIYRVTLEIKGTRLLWGGE